MTAAPAPSPDEPVAPTRGLTAQERGRDVSAAQTEAAAAQSTFRRMLASMHPRFLWSMSDGYPSVLKQFIQFCLIVIYPAWLFGVLLSALIYAVVYAVLWVVFWPVRAWMKKNRPDEYAASQRK